LLFLRAVIYRWIAPFWVAKLDLGMVVPPFRSDWFGGMLLFSFLSFGLMLGVFYIGLLFLSLLAGPDPIHSLVKVPLGRVDGWSRWAKLLLPFLGAAAGFWLVSWLILSPVSMAARFEQSVVVGMSSYLVWKLPASALLVLHLLSSYIYFGRHPFWKYVGATAQIMLKPMRKMPLGVRKVDFAPVLGLVMVFLLAEGVGRGLAWVFLRLPF
jgi:uncharacterized protein YggT (Ycf19 family)